MGTWAPDSNFLLLYLSYNVSIGWMIRTSNTGAETETSRYEMASAGPTQERKSVQGVCKSKNQGKSAPCHSFWLQNKQSQLWLSERKRFIRRHWVIPRTNKKSEENGQEFKMAKQCVHRVVSQAHRLMESHRHSWSCVPPLTVWVIWVPPCSTAQIVCLLCVGMMGMVSPLSPSTLCLSRNQDVYHTTHRYVWKRTNKQELSLL